MNNHGVNIAMRFFGVRGNDPVSRKPQWHRNLWNLTLLEFAVCRVNIPEFLFTPPPWAELLQTSKKLVNTPGQEPCPW